MVQTLINTGLKERASLIGPSEVSVYPGITRTEM